MASRKTRVTTYLAASVLEHLSDAVYWTPGASLSSLVEAAVRRHLAVLERQRGTPFPRRNGPLPVGRRVQVCTPKD